MNNENNQTSFLGGLSSLVGKVLDEGNILSSISSVFPFWDDLMAGEIPIPERYIESYLESEIDDFQGVKSLSLKCVPGRLLLRIETGILLLFKNYAEIPIEIETFEISKNQKTAMLSFPDDIPDIRGKNLLGKLSAYILQGIINSWLKSEDRSKEISGKTDGMVKLNWPEAIINFEEYPLIKGIENKQFGGKNLFDYFSLMSCSIKPGFVILKVQKHF